MKVYRTKIAARGLTIEQARNLLRIDPRLSIEQIGETPKQYRFDGRSYNLRRRMEFLHEIDFTPAQIAKLLPTWAKHKTIRSIGAQVAAFYRENNKVICRLHECGGLIGSQEYYDWQETQPDCWRTTDAYRRSIGTNHAFS